MRLIDADALLEEMVGITDGWLKPPKGWKWYEDSVRNAPTIEAEPVRHGRWIKMTGMMPPEYHGHYECSECHWHMKGIRSSWTREEELTYCPNCGVIMDGDEYF